MTVPSVDLTTLNDLTPNLDIGDVADPALRKAAFQYIYNKLTEIVSDLNAYQGAGAVGTAQIANLGVTTGKLAELAVTTGKIAELAVTTAKINDLAVTLAKMAASSVGSTQLVDLSVITAKLNDLAVTTLKLADLSVTTPKLAELSVTNPKMADDAVDGRVLANGSVDSQHIAGTLLASAASLATQSEFDKRGVNIEKYGADPSGVNDSTAAIQAAVSANKHVISPPNSTFKVTGSITIPDDVKLDFNGSVLSAINSIPSSPLVLNGSNITIQNVAILQEGRNYSAPSGVEGIALKPGKNVENILLRNVKVEGFENGINISPQSGFLAKNVKVENCITNYAELAGINISNARNAWVLNHYATFNRLDGLKTTENAVGVRIEGGYFSYNQDPVGIYADGIDLYAGGNEVVVSGAVCEYNGGVGIHILSGEENDPVYRSPIGAIIQNIIIADCICNNNINSGMDVISKTAVSATSPFPSKIIIKGCISHDNRYGITLNARHVTLSGCMFSNNQRHGVQISGSIYIIVDNCQCIKNGVEVAATYVGIYIYGSMYVSVNGGIINGSDSATLQKEDGSALTKYHLYGVWVDDTGNCDFISVNDLVIVNYTGPRSVYVTGFATGSNANKMIVVRLGDVGSNPLNNQIGFYGSTLYKSGRRYIKKTNLNSVVWDLDLQTVYGSQNLTANGVTTVFTIPHGLGAVPVRFAVTPKTSLGASGYFVTVDATNITITYTAAPASGTITMQWEASA